MLQYSWYSVISPEGCAAILWRDAANAPEAAEALKLASEDLMGLGVIDRVIPEPPGGAHNDPPAAAEMVKTTIIEELDKLLALSSDQLLRGRLEKYRAMGAFTEQEGQS
jgi:acetyl-CoA carboxylase carboxyl transferase subunit alpha